MEFNKNVKGEIPMNGNLLNVLSSYCNNEIENLKNSELYVKLQKLVDELNYIIVCEYGKELDNKKSENLLIETRALAMRNERRNIKSMCEDGWNISDLQI